MTDVAARFRAFQHEIAHWVDLLADVPARHVLRHDTIHPAFHGCIDWHSACHAVWALVAHRRLTGDPKHEPVVDAVLLPEKLAREAADLAARPDFEMPYGRAWLLRLALEDRLATGSTRLTFFARDIAQSLIEHLRAQPPEPFAREYANPCWALINLWDYAEIEGRADIADFVRMTVEMMSSALKRLPAQDEENSWPDFMAVTPNFCDLLVRTGVKEPAAVVTVAGEKLLGMKPVTAPQKPHHYALNFSRAWALFGLFDATRDERLLALALDHLETGLHRPSWWRGDYRAVAHWVPQFAIFALQRARHSAGKAA